VGDVRLAVQACDDGTFRSDMAADMLTEKGGYTNLSVIEGGIDG
jgi:rhodanese-related sulfurtransferase